MKSALVSCTIVLLFYTVSTFGAEDGANDEDASGKKLIDLNFDCLENVCKFLENNDLLNVAQANSHLTEAALYTLNNRIGKIIHITDKIEFIAPEPKDKKLGEISNPIILNSTKFQSSIPFIKDGITAIAVHFKDLWNSRQVLHDIIDCCSEQLTTLEFHGITDWYPTLNVTFPRVETLAFVDGVMNNNLLQFNEWFPAMKSLRLSNVTIQNPNLIVVQWPNLESFATEIDSRNSLSISRFERMLQLNPQIRSLNILEYQNRDNTLNIASPNSNLDVIQIIKQTLPDLQELTIPETLYIYLPPERNYLVTFPNVTEFDVNFHMWDRFKAPVPFDFEHLDSLTIRFTFWMSNMQAFITRQTNLTTLSLTPVSTRTTMEMSALLETLSKLPILATLNIENFVLTKDGMINILTMFPPLKKFQYVYRKVAPYYKSEIADSFQSVGWSYTIDRFKKYDIFIFKR